MPLRDSYDVYVEIDGARPLEYDITFDERTNPPTVSCWIPSQSGKVALGSDEGLAPPS
jgi:hypothetical protein